MQWRSIFLSCVTNKQTKLSKLVWISPIWRDRNTFAWRESFSLVRDFCQKDFWTILLWRVGKSTQLLKNDKNLFLSKSLNVQKITENIIFSKMMQLLIQLIRFKSCYVIIFRQNSSIRINGPRDHPKWTHVIFIYRVI